MGLESRQCADGQEQWLDWDIHLPGTGLVGFVQQNGLPLKA
jgi:hypothetical protein